MKALELAHALEDNTDSDDGPSYYLVTPTKGLLRRPKQPDEKHFLSKNQPLSQQAFSIHGLSQQKPDRDTTIGRRIK